ncbi:MAG: c-type cytochrome [Gammaproteobacteria bacterium]
MFTRFIPLLSMLFICGALSGCGDSGEPATEQSRPTAAETPQQPAMDAVTTTEDSVEEAVATAQVKAEDVADAVVQQAEEVMDKAGTVAEETVADATAAMEDIVSADKPYQLVDGKISDNVMEGWRTYNGGGCGACHGKGGIGAVGPNLAVSVTEKLTKEQFNNIVTNGVSGTMMRPHNTNTRVMDNLDNLYAYLVARGDGVLGPGNLIKSPLGKE